MSDNTDLPTPVVVPLEFSQDGADDFEDATGETAQPAALVPAGPTDRVLLTAGAIAEEQEQRKLLAAYVQSQLVEGVDYGVIPGTSKPTLYKPGAEKLCELFRCTAELEEVETIEDWDRPLFFYKFKARVRHRASGQVIAEGVGSCNSRESRYRWREQNRKCPECGAEAIIKGKAEYGGGWLCWAKKGGCGCKWDAGDDEIEGQTVGRVENPDISDLANTILKMAKKRALVDAAIALGRVSDLFTQDVEDGAPAEPREAQEAKTLTASQVKEVKTCLEECRKAGHPVALPQMLDWLKVTGLERVPQARLGEVLMILNQKRRGERK